MYYVQENGKGMSGIDMVDSMAKVEEILAQYEDQLVLDLKLLKKFRTTCMFEPSDSLDPSGPNRQNATLIGQK
jgi:hypothetical protein